MAKKKPQISLSSAEEVRDKITAKQTKQIQAMFTKLAKEAREKAKKLEGRDNISSIIQKKYLEDLAKELEHQLNADFANLKKNLEQDMTQVSESVIDCVREFEESVGMPISNSWLNVPVDAVEAVQSGKLYAGNWTLSSRIWGMEKKVMKDINTVIAEGIAANKSAYDIAKDLEKYVDPKAKKDWNWSKVYPGTNRKVDYSAQRLARTMVSHAYQFSFVESTKDNPYITKYKWISSHDKRVCPICKERDGKLFDKDKLPLDHPNGRCTFVSVFNKSATQISDEMAAWVKGKEGDFPKLDEYMKKRFGTDRYDKAMQMAQQAMEQKVEKESGRRTIVDGDPDAINKWNRRDEEFDFEIEDVINYQGFDGIPRIVDADKFDELVKKSNFIAQRTYSASSQEILDAYRDQLYDGKWYVDCSTGGAQYGQGMYCAADYDGVLSEGIKEEMKHYQELNEKRGNPLSYTETFTLDESAKIIKFNDLEEMKATNARDLKGHFGKFVDDLDVPEDTKNLIRAKPAFATDEQKRIAEEIYGNMSNEEREEKTQVVAGYVRDAISYANNRYGEITNMNIGSFAVLNGYDAINAEGHGESGSYTVILNRTKLIIKRG